MIPARVREIVDALGGCDAVASSLSINPRTVRRWYSGARQPGARAQALMLHAVDERIRLLRAVGGGS